MYSFLMRLVEIGGVNVLDFAHAAEFGVEGRAHDRAGVSARDANGEVAMAVDGSDQILVDFAHEHLTDDIHRRGRGDALAVLELHGEVEGLEGAVDGLAATMDDDDVHAQDLEQDDIAHDVGAELLVDHGSATVLDDDGLARDVLNPRKRLEKDVTGPLVGVLGAMACVCYVLHARLLLRTIGAVPEVDKGTVPLSTRLENLQKGLSPLQV